MDGFDINRISEEFERGYMNIMQLLANIVDPNILVVEGSRAVGKTTEVTSNRMIRVGDSMPGECSFIVHKTYVALLTNVWPNIQSSFAKEVNIGGVTRPMLQYGIDYVAGETKLPSHFRLPRRPISYPKHSIVFRNGHHFQLVSSDQPESVAGQSGVHAFVEEMKHNDGQKLKTRLFPSLRGSSAEIRRSPYYQGWTGVSDTARVDLHEDDWFEGYEDHVNKQLISEIITVALHCNEAMFAKYDCLFKQKHTTDPVMIEKLRLAIQRAEHRLSVWLPRLADMRRNATLYIRASSFANKDILGPKFFKTQMDTLDMDEFLTAICAVHRKAVVNMFFIHYDKTKHCFSDSYIYESILSLDLKEHFVLTARYLKHYNKRNTLLIGYDPGHFSSLVVAQTENYGRVFRVIKEFYACYPDEQPDLARKVWEFFGADAINKHIVLYPDRAGNKTREELEQVKTDSRAMQKELESYGFTVELMNEGQGTIYHWQQFKLMSMLMSGRSNVLPQLLIDENECPNLVSAIPLSPLKKTNGKIELDKTSEKKVPLKRQAGLTTQLPSAFIYLCYGLFGDKIKSDLSTYPDNLPDNVVTN